MQWLCLPWNDQTDSQNRSIHKYVYFPRSRPASLKVRTIPAFSFAGVTCLWILAFLPPNSWFVLEPLGTTNLGFITSSNHRFRGTHILPGVHRPCAPQNWGSYDTLPRFIPSVPDSRSTTKTHTKKLKAYLSNWNLNTDLRFPKISYTVMAQSPGVNIWGF